jgi:putative holliday junction resolvase
MNTQDLPGNPHPALGIDPGLARVGIAATDAFGILAHPVETIVCARQDVLGRIEVLCRSRGIRTLVVGLPVRGDGSEGEAAKRSRTLGAELRHRLPDLPLVWIDESYSTLDATEKLREAGRSAKSGRAVIDQAAAVEILNRWMRGSEPPLLEEAEPLPGSEGDPPGFPRPRGKNRFRKSGH